LASQASRPDYRGVLISGLKVGQKLPELIIPITHRLIVAGAIATQDFTPVHHNLPAAQAAGMPDIFMNILTTCGLSARYLTDWAGSGSRLTQVKFKLMAPNHPGDVMRLNGEVIAVNSAPTGGSVEVAYSGQNRLGIHISGTATLAMSNSSR
jgi:acyl dehydratase